MGSQDDLRIEYVHGSSILTNNYFSIDSLSNTFYYIAGSNIASFSIDTEINHEIQFTTSKILSCITVSNDAKYLAYGDCNHKNPTCVIVDLQTKKEISILEKGHVYGVSCVRFLHDSNYIITIGFKNDKHLIIWDISSKTPVSIHKVNNKVYSISLHPSNNSFVTCGDRHFKFWNVDFNFKSSLSDSITSSGVNS